MRIHYMLLIAVFFIPFSGLSQQLTAKEIIKKSEELMRGTESVRSEMSIKVVRPKWERTMKLKSWAKGDDYSMILMTAPDREKGIVFLKRKKEIWNWRPSIERMIKLPPSMMSQSWMGTDLSNDDLVKQSSIIDDYHQKIMKDSTIDGRLCWKIQLTPKEDADVIWGKINIWIDKKKFFQMRTEMYDEDEILVNVMQSSDVKKFGDKEIPSKMEIIPVEKKGQKTIMTYDVLVFDEDRSDSFFTIQNMKKVH